MDPDEVPPLWRALSARDFSRASQLISEGASLDDLMEYNGNTFLHDAAQCGDLAMVDFFLKHPCPKSLETFDDIQQTPLIRAAANGKADIVLRLLGAGVDPNARDEQNIGNTAIREAVRSGHIDIVAMLLHAGADPTIPGWMAISAVDQAWDKVSGSEAVVEEIRQLLSSFPSSLRASHQTGF